MPKPHDPDSFIKAYGGEAFRKLVESADGFFDYYLNRLCATNEITTDKGRITVLLEMAEAVHKTGNVVLVDKYAQKTALRLGVSPEAVRAEFKKAPAQKSLPVAAEEESFENTAASEVEMLDPFDDEFAVLQLLLKNDELIDWITNYFNPLWIENETVRRILEARIHQHREQLWQGLPQFLEFLNDESLKALVTKAVSLNYRESKRTNDHKRGRTLLDPLIDLQGFAKEMRNQFLDRQIAALTQKASQPKISNAYKIELLREWEELREQKRSSLSQLQN
jgi:DNA primase